LIEIAPSASSYTVSYGNKSDTYAIKGSSLPVPASDNAPGLNPSGGDIAQPKYAYSVRGTVYYYVTCVAVKRISPDNLRYSVTPPTGLNPSACVLASPTK
jgi:hypothetical protein